MDADDKMPLLLSELVPVWAVIGVFKGRGPTRGGLRARGDLRHPALDAGSRGLGRIGDFFTSLADIFLTENPESSAFAACRGGVGEGGASLVARVWMGA